VTAALHHLHYLPCRMNTAAAVVVVAVVACYMLKLYLRAIRIVAVGRVVIAAAVGTEEMIVVAGSAAAAAAAVIGMDIVGTVGAELASNLSQQCY
jgi:hypothetical protein